MTRKLMVLIIFVLIIGSFGFLLMDDKKPMQDNTAQNQTNAMQNNIDGAESTSAESGQYVAYSESAFLDASQDTRLLFFHAPWCPQCRDLEASITSGQIPKDVSIFKVDYDSAQSLRQKYGVTIQTTVVKVDAEGNLVAKYVAYDDPTFDNVAANLL